MRHSFLGFCAVAALALATTTSSMGHAAKGSESLQGARSNPPVVIMLAQGGAVRECPVDKRGKPYCGNNCPLCK